MHLSELIKRLLDRLRRLLDGGSTTESALARRLGLSQSHLHNILKGVRGLTTATADQWLERMDWTVLDLFDDNELRAEIARRKTPRSKTREIPVASIENWNSASPQQWLAVAKPQLLGLARPILLLVDTGIDTGGVAESGEFLLADLTCDRMESGAAYVLLSGGQYRLRWTRKGTRCIYLACDRNWHHPMQWERVEKIRLIARIHGVAKRPTDTFRPPVPPSAAN